MPVRELKEKARKLKRHSMISNGLNEQVPEYEESMGRIDKSVSTGI